MTLLYDETPYQLLEIRSIQSALTARKQKTIGLLEHIEPDHRPKQHPLLAVVELLQRRLCEELLILLAHIRVRVSRRLIMIAEDHIEKIGTVWAGERHLTHHCLEKLQLFHIPDPIPGDTTRPSELQHRLLRHHLEATLLQLRLLHDPGLLIHDIRVPVSVCILKQ